MPCRTRAQNRGATPQNASDEASTRPSFPTCRGSGHGSRGRSRGRGGRVRVDRTKNSKGGVAPTPNLTELMTTIQELKGTVETLVRAIVDQGKQRGESHVDRDPQGVEVQVGQQLLQDDEGVRVSYLEFFKLQPPSFFGSNASEDPQQFLDGIERVCRALGCSSQRTVQLAEFRLQDVAQIWFEDWLRGRPQGSPDPTWEEFKTSFMERFFPESMRRARAREFEDLRQIPSMSVAEYDIRFTQLSRYAPHLVSTERMRTERFIKGLVRPLFQAMAPHMETFPSYLAAVDCALMLEMREMETHASYEKTKKTKIEGNFSGRSSGRSGKRSRSQVRQRTMQWNLGSTGQVQVSSQGVRHGLRGQGQISHQGSASSNRPRPSCSTCGKVHAGQCHRETGACFNCGQVGHLRRNCPQLSTGSSHGSV